MLEFERSAQHSQNEDRIHDPRLTPCIICGRGVRHPWRHTVHLYYGNTLVTDDEAAGLDDGGDMGAWPIGADCLKQHPEIVPYLIG